MTFDKRTPAPRKARGFMRESKGPKADVAPGNAAQGPETPSLSRASADAPPPGPSAPGKVSPGDFAASERQGLASGGSAVRDGAVSGESVKEKRGRRFTTEESCRRGLADVANKVRDESLDPKRGAVIVQAINGILAILGVREAAEINAKAAQLEQAARAAGMGDGEPHA